MMPHHHHEVKLVSREMVLPAARSPPGPFFLPCFDLFWQDIHYNRRLLFYEGPASHDDDDAQQSRPLHGRSSDSDGRIQQLKGSLAICLVHYYCWCGRIAKGLHPPHRLFIDCNDAGVEFVEASMDMPLSLLARDGFQMKPFFDELCQSPDHKGDSLFSSPLLSIQATFFSDGGLSLGIAQSHIVADGQSLWDFMVSWGECSRGVPLSVPPLHDRQRLAVPDPSPEKATWMFDIKLSKEDEAEEEDISTKTGSSDEDNGKTITTDPSTDVCKVKADPPLPAETSGEHGNASAKLKSGDSLSNDSNSAVNDGAGKNDPKPDSSLVQWMFTLSSSAIKKLKAEAGEGYTSFDVTCAHFWKRTCAARKAPSNENTYLATPVNCRTRWSPPLPRAYFGNVIAFCMVVSKVRKIQREPFCATANRIHSQVATVNQGFMEGFMHWLETHDNNIRSLSKTSRPLGKGINVASSPWFPAYEVDFGWGKPVAVRVVKVTGNGELVFFGGKPGSNRGDVEICTALPGDVLDLLLKDPLFVAESPCPN